MRKIELKSVEAVLMGEEQNFSYGDMIKVLLELPENPEKGATIAEVRQSIKVLDALDESDKEIELEDADFAYVLKRVRNAKWASANKVFIDFVDYIEGLDG